MEKSKRILKSWQNTRDERLYYYYYKYQWLMANEQWYVRKRWEMAHHIRTAQYNTLIQHSFLVSLFVSFRTELSSALCLSLCPLFIPVMFGPFLALVPPIYPAHSHSHTHTQSQAQAQAQAPAHIYIVFFPIFNWKCQMASQILHSEFFFLLLFIFIWKSFPSTCSTQIEFLLQYW